MNSSSLLRPSPPPLLFHRNRFVISSSSRKQSYIPKLEPFSRSKLDRLTKSLPLIEKSEKDLIDYCCTLEGDECYNCWQAYSDLKDLEKVLPRRDIERLIIQIGGVKSLIGCLHAIAVMHKSKIDEIESEDEQNRCPRPDGLPKSAEEMMEEEEAKMPDSSYTKLYRSMGKSMSPAWYSKIPDHETD